MARSFYKTGRWKRKRGIILRRDNYLCRECRRYGKTTPATSVHHVQPLEHRPELALVSSNLISLCDPCHNSMHNRDNGQLSDKGLAWVARTS